MHADNAREREVERRLSRLESPQPPADLLDRIRADIPDHLRPVEAPPAEVRPARRYRLAAASLFLAVAGGFLAYRVLREAPPPEAGPPRLAAPPVAAPVAPPVTEPQDRAAAPPPLTTEVGAAEEDAAQAQRQTPPAGIVGSDPGGAPPRTLPEAAEERRPTPTGKEAGLADESSNRRLRPDSPAEAAAEEVAAAAPRGEPDADRLGERLKSRAAPGADVELQPVRIVDEVTVEAEVPRRSEPISQAATATFGEAAAPPTARVAPGPGRRPAPPPPPNLPSTGGSAEPNDQPWGDMFFRPYGTNPFVDTEDDPRSTFGLDVDTGSYTLARSYLERGHLPPPEAIRVEEFLNYFDYRDPAPRRGEFTLTAEGAPSPWLRGPRYQLLRLGVRGREVSLAERRDATLIFVVDVSGSMARDDRIGLVRRALGLLLGQLGPGDRVGLVVYGSRGQVLLQPTGDLETVRRAVDRLSTGGSTNAEEGLVLAYELARRHYRAGAINRLVLCSDGVANVGRTGPESILERIGREAEEGIELTTVGFGMGNYNDVLMEQLADRGDGNYAYVDSLEEARRVFVENLTGTLQTLASDAKIQVEFDPRTVARYRLLGYENRDVADHRFRDDSVDAGELGAGHRVTALYELKLVEGAPRRGRLAEVRLRYRSRETDRVVEESLVVRRSDLARSWRAASPSLRLAALAAELAEVLKRSYWARETRPEELRQRARAVERDFPGDRDVAELVRLSERATGLVDWPDGPLE